MTEAHANLIASAGERCDWLLSRALRCRATAKGTGERCRCPAIAGRPTCRAHGGKGGAPRGQRNGAWMHGRRSVEHVEEKRQRRELLRLARLLIGELG